LFRQRGISTVFPRKKKGLETKSAKNKYEEKESNKINNGHHAPA